MKSINIMALVTLAVLALGGCAAKNNSFKLQGEWEVKEVSGSDNDNEVLYIGFKPEKGVIYGAISSCNNFTADLTLDESTKQIKVENIGTTRATCPDDADGAVLAEALLNAEKYDFSSDGDELTIYDKSKKAVLKLEKKSDADSVATAPPVASESVMTGDAEMKVIPSNELEGEWAVLSIGDMLIKDQKINEEPMINFEMDSLRVSGNLSCNRFFSSIKVNENADDQARIKFEGVRSTRMACSNMEIEYALSTALNAVDHFYLCEKDSTIGLYEGEKLLVLLTRKK